MEAHEEAPRESKFKPMGGDTWMKIFTFLFLVANHGFFVLVPIFYLVLSFVFIVSKLAALINRATSKGTV